VIFMNADDIAGLGLESGAVVDLTSRFGDETRTAPRFVVVPYDIPRGSAAAYFPEANPLVPLGQIALRSGTPASKSIVIEVRRAPLSADTASAQMGGNVTSNSAV
jgi:anaerobic selenocysteine-containing dehydrogenase